MSARSSLIEEIEPSLAVLGRIVARRMFSGFGIYCDGLMFAIVIDDVLYLKTGEANRAQFTAQGLKPFAYRTKTAKTVETSYYRAPEHALDDPDELRLWAGAAVAAARAASSRKGAGPAPPRKTAAKPKRAKRS